MSAAANAAWRSSAESPASAGDARSAAVISAKESEPEPSASSVTKRWCSVLTCSPESESAATSNVSLRIAESPWKPCSAEKPCLLCIVQRRT